MKSLLVMIETTSPGVSSTGRDHCRDEQRTWSSVTNRNSNPDAMIATRSAPVVRGPRPVPARVTAQPDRRIHYAELRDERRGERCDVQWDERYEKRKARRIARMSITRREALRGLMVVPLAGHEAVTRQPGQESELIVFGWDEVWALGGDVLRAYAVGAPGGSTTLERRFEMPLPDRGGHDLVALPGSSRLFLSTGRRCFYFDRDRRQLSPHETLGDRPDVKSYNVHRHTGRIVYVQAEGSNWWAEHLHFAQPEGTLRLPGEHLYKARWV
jgi:hypothetical protein